MILSTHPTVCEIEAWLVAHVADELEVDASEIDPKVALTRYGLDSLAAVTLAGDLERWLGCALPPTFLREHGTIERMSQALIELLDAGHAAPQGAGTIALAVTEYSEIDYTAWPPRQARLRKQVAWGLNRLARIDVEGLENVPAAGPLVIAFNHLNMLDAPLLFATLPRRTVFMVADNWSRVPVIHWFARTAGTAIYIDRTTADREALARAGEVLRSGGALGVAPEGTFSRTGGLIQGRSGAAYLASLENVPVLPVAIHGQEHAVRCWRRMQRVPIHIKIGKPFTLPHSPTAQRELATHTEAIMRAIAEILPESYRGIYAAGTPDGGVVAGAGVAPVAE